MQYAFNGQRGPELAKNFIIWHSTVDDKSVIAETL